MSEFADQLERQIGFVRASAELYDHGYVNEAVRLATSLRILFHDTAASVSLLSHLTIKKKAQVLDTFGDVEKPLVPGAKPVLSIHLSITLGGPGTAEISAPLGTSTRKRWLPAEEWWNQVVSIHGEMKLTRRQVVLSASNQDGGAHVDAKLSPLTSAVKQGFFTAFRSADGKPGMRKSLRNFHFPLLRQFAYEVLNSPDLTSLQTPE